MTDIMIDNVTLEEAKKAYLAMQDLQQKAALYPQLKREAEKREAEARLEQLKEQCIEDFQDNIEGYEQLKGDFQKLYNEAQKSVEKAASVLRQYRNQSRKLDNIANTYANSAWEFDLTYNGAQSYKDNVSIFNYRAEIATKNYNEHPIEESDYNDLYDVIRKNM